MTNFSGLKQNDPWAWLSPERAVLVLPVLAGLGLSVVLFSVGVTPLTLSVKNQEEVVKELAYKSEMLPLLRQNLGELALKQQQRQQQLDRLLALVAGTSELTTFLAELNDLANRYRVTVTTTEPGAVERFVPPVSPSDSAPPPAAGGANAPQADSLLREGLEKRSAGLTVKGPFPQVLDFLRALERLQVFVIISDMEVNAEGLTQQQDVSPADAAVTMSLTLTAYGRQPEAEPMKGPR